VSWQRRVARGGEGTGMIEDGREGRKVKDDEGEGCGELRIPCCVFF
jgi:hypothetical protein